MGKGDKPRNCFSNLFRTNFDEIDWGNRTIDEVCGVPKGTFQKELEEKNKNLAALEKQRARRVRKENANLEPDGEESEIRADYVWTSKFFGLSFATDRL